MNDATVHDIWKALEALASRLSVLEDQMQDLAGRVRARLKEEADARRM
ncbi:MAG: hypothetical protein LN413_07030 [Candidatus Thermoplasmatota archaeon]|nr:hypothetical protein [Candidatus Thermoplasmatota archaeon]